MPCVFSSGQAASMALMLALAGRPGGDPAPRCDGDYNARASPGGCARMAPRPFWSICRTTVPSGPLSAPPGAERCCGLKTPTNPLLRVADLAALGLLLPPEHR